MIINVRGTSGSGKSTLVRRIRERYEPPIPAYIEGRKQPIAYTHHRTRGKSLWVPGHYETPCGGCDTIPTMDAVYALVRNGDTMNCDVIYEGLLVQSDVNRLIKIHTDKIPIMVVFINTPIEECIEGIMARRRARGDERELDPSNTIAKDGQTRRSLVRMRAAGVRVEECNREDAFLLVSDEFGW